MSEPTDKIAPQDVADALDDGPSRIEALCVDHGLRMTGQRRVIAQVLSNADDHPDAEELYRRVSSVDSSISLSTVYRTVRVFEDAGILERHDFGEGRARFETAGTEHHDHLIDIDTGEVIEFRNEDIEHIQERVARELGFTLVGHKLELYGRPIGRAKPEPEAADETVHNDTPPAKDGTKT